MAEWESMFGSKKKGKGEEKNKVNRNYSKGEEENNEETQENGPQNIRVDPEYARLVQDLSASAGDEKSQKAIVQIFSTPEVRKTYEILKDDGLSRRTIRDIMSSEGAIRNMIKYGGKISTTDYLEGVVKALRRNEHYAEVVEDMHDAGVISERTYRSAGSELHGDTEKHIRRAKSGLERAVAIWILLVAGVLIMVLSGFAVTGGVIGTKLSPTLGFVLGFVLFVIGLLLKK